MSIVIILIVIFIFMTSIILNIWLYLINRDLYKQLDLTNNSLKLWLDSEVEKKRNFSKLSDALILDRDDYRNRYLSLSKKYNRLNRYIKSFIKWRISIDILISKIR